MVRLNLLPLEYYWTLVLLGVLLGLLGWIYQKHCCPYQKYMEKSKAFLLIIMVLFLFILILPIGYFFPHLLGGGNQIVLALGNQPTTIWALVGLLVLRFVFNGFLRFESPWWYFLAYSNFRCHYRNIVWQSTCPIRRDGSNFCEKLLILPWLVILLRLVKHR